MDFSKYGTPSKEWLEFIAHNPAAAKEGFSGNDILEASQLRQAVNANREVASEKLMAESGLKNRVDISTLSIPSRASHTIPLRRYSPVSQHGQRQDPRQGLVYFHGGGFLFGSEKSDDCLCASIADSLGVVVLSVIYRHTPEWSHPAPHEDTEDVMAYIERSLPDLGIEAAKGLSILGISAGAGLAAAAVLRDLRGQRLVQGVILSIPWLIHVDNYPFNHFVASEKSAQVQCRNAPVIPWPRLKMFSDLLRAEDYTDPLLNTALVPDVQLSNWPKTAFVAAGMDPLRDDGLLFSRRLEALGIPTSVYIFPGLPHGFRRWQDLPATKVFDARMLESIRWTLGLGGHEENEIEGWHEYQ
ncbi:Alpha/Beta hydrolase protein [Penicillium lagena]|uniref:Alpha/Beta hydrolase protein n=1 Tax=Penicillium lagena TaxID=94218 RepID=UPI00253FE8A3|nr:Alpha/Beta hydrolase protein [Penicillium lagena]KAJ5604591.1 Alpha/Beta hydrolase protein [Penicillium lagena]